MTAFLLELLHGFLPATQKPECCSISDAYYFHAAFVAGLGLLPSCIWTRPVNRCQQYTWGRELDGPSARGKGGEHRSAHLHVYGSNKQPA